MNDETTNSAGENFARELARCRCLHLPADLEGMFPGIQNETPADRPEIPANIIRNWYETAGLLEDERSRSDGLLRNILPDAVTHELRKEKSPPPVHYDSATVVFTDFVGFSRTAGDMKPMHLVQELDRYFSAYDAITEKYGLEKLKTIGDSYMYAAEEVIR